MLFSAISNLCQLLEKESSRLEKIKILHKFFIENNPLDIKHAINFLSLSIENNSSIFQINEIILIKYISEYLNIPLEQTKNDIKLIGDLGLFFNKNNKININSQEHITLENIINILIELQNIKGKNSQIEKKIKLFSIFDRLNNIDVCYIIRFLTRSLRIGLTEKTIIEALHKILINNNHDIKKNTLFTIYAISSNIGNIAEKILKNDLESLLLIKPKIGNFIQPQAAEIYIKEKKQINIKEKQYVDQIKLDGFRLQAHVKNNFTIFFSRNGLITDYMFPEIIISIKEYIKNNNIHNAIFDGEIIGFDLKNNKYLSFEQIAKRKRKHNIKDNTDLCKTRFIIFDLLYYNDTNLLNTKYKERLDIIKTFKDNDEIITIDYNNINTEEDIEKSYKEALKNKHEGIIIKDLTSIYEPGKRTTTWLKYKEVQKNSIEDLIDVVILGYTIAKGNRKSRQKIGSLLVGLYNDKKDIFETLAQVGTGGNTIMWNNIEDKIHKFISLIPLQNVSINKKHNPDFYIQPEIIISLKADKITKSKDHTSGYSIRFPRIISIRSDKNKYQTHCPTLEY